MVEAITLTNQFKNRLNNLLEVGIKSKNFNPDSIDIRKSFSVFQKDKQVIADEIKGFMRLIEQPKFKQRQIDDLKNHIKENLGLVLRYLVTFPKEFPDYNKLREVFLEIQEKAGMKKLYLFFGKSESFETIKSYIDKLDSKEYVLVLEMDTEYRVLYPILKESLNKFNEVIFVYRDWRENLDNFTYVIRQAEKNQNLFHMAFVPVDLNIYGNKEIFSTILICKGFKSISLVDTEFKAYFIRWKNPRKVKTREQKINESRWINDNSMSYQEKHKIGCLCFGKDNAKNLLKQQDIKSVITYHNLEVLSKTYLQAKTDIKVKERLLNLDAIKPILVSLKI